VTVCFAAVFVCYIDRVNISLAIVPMAREFGWSKTTSGFVMSSFFIGYLLTQVPGGILAGRFGGKHVLAGGVLFWSLFTALTPPSAYAGFGALIGARILMGMVTFPSILHAVVALGADVAPVARGRARLQRDPARHHRSAARDASLVTRFDGRGFYGFAGLGSCGGRRGSR
jgi:ACS family sodium-dependent inorganic phosphate cotransporter